MLGGRRSLILQLETGQGASKRSFRDSLFEMTASCRPGWPPTSWVADLELLTFQLLHPSAGIPGTGPIIPDLAVSTIEWI